MSAIKAMNFLSAVGFDVTDDHEPRIETEAVIDVTSLSCIQFMRQLASPLVIGSFQFVRTIERHEFGGKLSVVTVYNHSPHLLLGRMKCFQMRGHKTARILMEAAQ